MTDRFDPRLDILPELQRRLWTELGSVPSMFVLYGGTAVALHLGHRQSVDFDFFAETSFDPEALALSVPLLTEATILQQAASTLTVIVDKDGPVRLSFFGLPNLRRLSPPLVSPDTGMRVATLLDLAGTKAEVVQRRAEAKDYIDLDAIFTDGRVNLPMALAAGRRIHGVRFNPQITLKALSFFGDGNLTSLPDATRARLVQAVRGVDLDRLPIVPDS
jgi:hypothetical protein